MSYNPISQDFLAVGLSCWSSWHILLGLFFLGNVPSDNSTWMFPLLSAVTFRPLEYFQEKLRLIFQFVLIVHWQRENNVVESHVLLIFRAVYVTISLC